MSTGRLSSERRLLVAARAIALRSADHHETLAEVADVDLERGQLLVVEAQSRDIDEDDAVVTGQAREVGRERLGDDRVDLLALVLERGDQLRGHLVVAGQDERSRLALDDRVGVGPIVLAERVACGLDHRAEGVEAGLGRLDVEGDAGQPGDELDRLGSREGAVGEEPDGRGLGDGRAYLDEDRDRFTEARRRRRGHPLDEDLVDVAEPDPARLDLDPACGCERGLGLAIAGRVVAVGEEDDPLLGVVREEGRRETQGAADVGRGLEGCRGDPVDPGQRRREPLDERALAEGDDPGDIVLGSLLEGLAQERQRVLATRVADRIGQVDDEDRREPVDREDELEARQREDERGEQQGPDDERDAAPARPHPTPRPQVEPDGEQKRRDEQEQRERRIEREAHQAFPSATFRPNRSARLRRSRMSASRW